MGAKNLTWFKDILTERAKKKEPGPLVTISREYGCPGTTIAHLLSEKLKEKVDLKEGIGSWLVVNKEIILLAAEEMDLSPETVEKITLEKSSNKLFDIFRNFSDVYIPDDNKVKTRIVEMILKLGYLGRFIIVGRGGALINRHIDHSVHVRLYAAESWRTRKVMALHNIPEDQAAKLLKATDRERNYLRSLYTGESLEQEHFDMMFNCATMSNEEIVSAIVHLMEVRKIVIG